MAKRKQQYELEKNLEYGGIEHMRVNAKARARFKAKAYEPRKPRSNLPRYTVDTYLASKGVDVKGEIEK